VQPEGTPCTDDADPCTPPLCSDGVCIQLESDGDGVGDLCDNCPFATNSSQLNSDCDDPTYLPNGGCIEDPAAKPGCCDGGDVCDPCPLSADNANCNANGSVGGEVGPSGATLTAPDNSLSLDVPSGAVDAATALSIIQNAAPVSSPLVVNNVSMNPPTQVFQQPVTLTFRWQDRENGNVGDGKVDVGTCVGGTDDGESCDADEDCASQNCTVHESDTPELDLTLQRDGRRFSALGFGTGPFTCADHLAGPGATCATAVADCMTAAGTGRATVANCCDPDANTWTFQTCNFNPTTITQPTSGLARTPRETSTTGVATAALQPRYAVLVPGLGSALTDCHAEWGPKGAEYNTPSTMAPKPAPPKPPLNGGVLNDVQTCRNGNGSCDATADNDCKCRFIVKVALNVADPRLRKAQGCQPPVTLGHQADPPPIGCYACGPSSIAKWTLKSPKPTDAHWGEVGKALIAAMKGLGGTSQSPLDEGALTFLSPVGGEPDTQEVLIDVPVKGKTGKMKAGKLTIRMQSETESGRKDTDKLMLICEPVVQPRRSAVRVPEAASAPARRRELDDLEPAGAGDRRDDQLRDAVAPPDVEVLAAEIDHQHLDLAAVVGVDRARAVRQRHAVAQGEAAARADLAFEAGRDLDGQAGRDQGAGAGAQAERLGHVGQQVHASGTLGLVGGQRQGVGGGANPLDRDRDGGGAARHARLRRRGSTRRRGGRRTRRAARRPCVRGAPGARQGRRSRRCRWRRCAPRPRRGGSRAGSTPRSWRRGSCGCRWFRGPGACCP
jgi:hypothetical protein